MKKIFTLFAALAMVLSMSAANIPAGTKLYLTPNANWKEENARYAAYFFGNGDAWVSMTAVTGETDLYEVTSPDKEYTNVIFCRMNPSTSNNNWDNKWNQTADLTYNGTQNWYTVKDGTWDSGGGTWALYAPEAPKTYKDITITVVANATPKIHYWDGGDKVTATEWESKPEMTATGEENTYSCTIKDVDEATGVKFLVVVGEVQSADQHVFENVTANFKELLPQVVVKGIDGDWGDTNKMTVSDDYLSASITLTLEAAKDYELKLTVNGEWFGSNAITITKDNNSASFAENGEGNGKLTTDLAGDYVFTYTYATKTLVVTYPVPTPTYTVTLLNDAGAELEGAGEYEEGSVATVIAPEEWDGYIFVSWVDEEGNGVSDDATTTVTVNQDITLTALYAMMMPLEVTDLEIVMDPVVGLMGSTELAGGTLSLQLVVDASAEGEDGEFPLTEDSQLWLGDTQFEFLEGIALIDMENNAAQAFVLAADDWGMIYYFDIEMSAAAPAEPTEVVVENAIITVEEQSDGMGGTYESVYVTAEWNGTLLKLEGIEKNFEGFLQITQIVDEATDDWYIWMAMNGTVTTVDNVLTVSGEFTNNFTGDVYNVTISGELDNTTTALDNVTTTVAPAKAIVNGQLVIVKDGVKYNAQGAVVK